NARTRKAPSSRLPARAPTTASAISSRSRRGDQNNPQRDSVADDDATWSSKELEIERAGDRKLRRHARTGMILGVIAALLVWPALVWPISVRAEELFDPDIRAAMLERKDGVIAHVETVYNDIFVVKVRNILHMTFHWKGYYFQESQLNLADPD